MNHMKMVSRCVGIVSVLVLVGFAVPAVAVDNIDPNDDGSQFAWGENTGWLNAEPGCDDGPGVFVEDDGLSGYLWSENTGWVSLSCLNTASCGTSDFGVTNNGNGTLAGYAWSENAGWISFSCANEGSCATKNYGVIINPATDRRVQRPGVERKYRLDYLPEYEWRRELWGDHFLAEWGGACLCPYPDADLNNDGIVNAGDLSLVGSCFSQNPPAGSRQVADTNCSGGVGIDDLQFVLGSFGQTVP